MKRRRLTPTYQIGIAAVVLWMLAIAGISQASAAQLTLLAGYQAQLFPVSACADGLDVVPADRKGNSANYGEVDISTIPSACNGLPLTFFLFDDSGDVVVTDSGTASTGVLTFSVSGNYRAGDVESAVVLIDTWPIPTTWSMTAPPPPTGVSCVGIDPATPNQTYPCTYSQSSTTTWVNGGYRYTQVNFNAVTSAPLRR